MKTFIIVFILVLLFVIGSASAMRYFGNRSLPRPDSRTPPRTSDSEDQE